MEKIVVDSKRNQVKLLFNPSFYQTQFIDKAIEDFSEICHMEKVDDVLLLEPKVDIDIELLGYEFYNYVLCLIKNT